MTVYLWNLAAYAIQLAARGQRGPRRPLAPALTRAAHVASLLAGGDGHCAAAAVRPTAARRRSAAAHRAVGPMASATQAGASLDARRSRRRGRSPSRSCVPESCCDWRGWVSACSACDRSSPMPSLPHRSPTAATSAARSAWTAVVMISDELEGPATVGVAPSGDPGAALGAADAGRLCNARSSVTS